MLAVPAYCLSLKRCFTTAGPTRRADGNSNGRNGHKESYCSTEDMSPVDIGLVKQIYSNIC